VLGTAVLTTSYRAMIVPVAPSPDVKTRLGIDYAQGYHVARPSPLPQTLDDLAGSDPAPQPKIPEQVSYRTP
jgi:hypothetical protein